MHNFLTIVMLIRVSPQDLDEFRGYRGLSFGGGGRFHLVEVGGRFYLADPDGYAFIIRGVNYVRFNADPSVAGGVIRLRVVH